MRLKTILAARQAAQHTPQASPPTHPGSAHDPAFDDAWASQGEAELLQLLSGGGGGGDDGGDGGRGGGGRGSKRAKLSGRDSFVSGTSSMTSLGSQGTTGLALMGRQPLRGVRFQGDNWQARTKRNGRELSLGLYRTAEEAGMAYDLDRLQQQGGKAQRLNFPLLRARYKSILSDLADLCTPDGLLDFLAVAVQEAAKAARTVPGALAPQNTGPAPAPVLNLRRTASTDTARAAGTADPAGPEGCGIVEAQQAEAAPAAAVAAAPPPVQAAPPPVHAAAPEAPASAALAEAGTALAEAQLEFEVPLAAQVPWQHAGLKQEPV